MWRHQLCFASQMMQCLVGATILVLFCWGVVKADGVYPMGGVDFKALMAFKATTGPSMKALASWNDSASDPCNLTNPWYGVECRKGRVTRLVLEQMELRGPIHPLTALDQLRILSLRVNNLSGTLPEDTLLVSCWKRLKFLYLSNNNFSGPIPESLSTLSHLVRIDLSNNHFTGSIPASLLMGGLHNLLTLRLANNELSGKLPMPATGFNLTKLQVFNVSRNHLSGPIPSSLSGFPIDSFQGNANLCGTPLNICTQVEPLVPRNSSSGAISRTNSTTTLSTPILNQSSENPTLFHVSIVPSPTLSLKKSSDRHHLSGGAIVAIIVGGIAFFLSIITLSLLIVVYGTKRTPMMQMQSNPKEITKPSPPLVSSPPPPPKPPIMPSATLERAIAHQPPGQYYSAYKADMERGRITFIDGRRQFELEDLLRATADIIGKGSFGTTYLATMGPYMVVVKRLKDIDIAGRKEFDEYMEAIGKLQHPNLVHLRAYFYAKREKLLVFDYFPNGSLHDHLHGGIGRTPLDWTRRVMIALGVAKGLAYIHCESKTERSFAHGNVKSSNVLLDDDENAYVADFSIAVMGSQSGLAKRLAAGYTAPEQVESGRPSQKGDVYAFGVLLLELLTGKTPPHLVPYKPRSLKLPDSTLDMGNALVPPHSTLPKDLPHWIKDVTEEELTHMLDPVLLNEAKEKMVKAIHISLMCTSESPESRPPMSQVVPMMEAIVDEGPSSQ